MKKVILLFTMVLLILSVASGQVHQITFSHTPPPIPVADAGPDTMVSSGSSFMLQSSVTGGTSPFSYLWQPGTHLNDSTLLSPTLTFPASGGLITLTFTVTDLNGCTSSDQVEISGYINSIPEAAPPPVKIYPNPSSGLIFIEGLTSAETSATVTVFSVTGKLLFTKSYDHNGGILKADIQPLNPGFYLLSVQYGEYRYMQKIVIQ